MKSVAFWKHVEARRDREAGGDRKPPADQSQEIGTLAQALVQHLSNVLRDKNNRPSRNTIV